MQIVVQVKLLACSTDRGHILYHRFFHYHHIQDHIPWYTLLPCISHSQPAGQIKKITDWQILHQQDLFNWNSLSITTELNCRNAVVCRIDVVVPLAEELGDSVTGVMQLSYSRALTGHCICQLVEIRACPLRKQNCSRAK